jgi:hypothetical protein
MWPDTTFSCPQVCDICEWIDMCVYIYVYVHRERERERERKRETTHTHQHTHTGGWTRRDCSSIVNPNKSPRPRNASRPWRSTKTRSYTRPPLWRPLLTTGIPPPSPDVVGTKKVTQQIHKTSALETLGNDRLTFLFKNK